MPLIKKHLILLCFTVLAVFAQPKIASAVGLNLKNIKPLTPVQFLPLEEFKKNTRLVKATPYGDDFLSFRVRMPREWEGNAEPAVDKEGTEGLSQRVLGPLARYQSPPNKHLRSFFTLEALHLTYEIGARNWFINYVLTNGLALEQVGVENKRQVEAIYVEVRGDITYIVRVKIILNGPRMVVARYFVPQELYEEEYVQQAQVIDSFMLTNREEVGVEKLEIYGFLDQSFFDYPISWALNAPAVRSIDRMKAMLYHSTVKGKLDGQINIYLTNKMTDTTRAKEIEFYREKFQIENYELGGFIESPNIEYHKDMIFGATQVYEMTPQVAHMFDYELWVTVLEGEEYFYIISLLSPSRNEEFYTWARNVEAFKLVVKGMRRNDETVDYFRFIQ